jgi:hypothetical protein
VCVWVDGSEGAIGEVKKDVKSQIIQTDPRNKQKHIRQKKELCKKKDEKEENEKNN